MPATAVASVRKAKPHANAEAAPTTEAPEPVAIRSGTRQPQIVARLQRPEGASSAAISAATAWQARTARGVTSGALKKKLGLPVTAQRVESRGTAYRIS